MSYTLDHPRIMRTDSERPQMEDPGLKFSMKNGTPYEIHPCIEPDAQFTARDLREQIRVAMKGMSARSRWQRFAAPVRELSEQHLDYLTDLDGKDRVAWCAAVAEGGRYRGIGLARYFRHPDETGTAEFAVTVIDEFQGQHVGRTLLGRLMDSARNNGIAVLRGYVLPGNKGMLELCKRLHAGVSSEDGLVRVDIPVPRRTGADTISNARPRLVDDDRPVLKASWCCRKPLEYLTLKTTSLLLVILGAWLGGSIVMGAVVGYNFAGFEDLFARNPALAAQAGFSIADEAAKKSSLLWVHSSELNRVFFETWNRAQLALGGIALLLAWLARGARIGALLLVAVGLVAFVQVQVAPELVELGRQLDFTQRVPPPPELAAFQKRHGLYFTLESIRLALVGVATLLLVIRRQPGSG